MAAATMSTSTFDLKGPTTYPIRLGDSITKSTSDSSKTYTSIRYNHLPHLKGGKEAKSTIKPSGDALRMQLQDIEGEKYIYSSRNAGEEGQGQYVLLLRGKEMVLEKVRGLEFNLIRTPVEKDEEKLRGRYVQFPVDEEGPGEGGGEEDGGGLFGDGDGEDEEDLPDPKNPFDYRHYLLPKPKSVVVKGKAREKELPSIPGSGAGTPQTHTQRQGTALPATKRTAVSQNKRKAPEKVAGKQPNPKRVKAGVDPEPTARPTSSAGTTTNTKPPTTSKPAPSQKATDHKPALHLPTLPTFPDFDSGELILENATPATEKPPPKSSMFLALSGQLAAAPLGTGPHSLRSVASSPGSRIATPLHRRNEREDEDDDFDLGGGMEIEEGEDDGDEVGTDPDADVEDFELPSPVQKSDPVRREREGSEEAVGGAEEVEDDEDEDDLEEQLELAMAEGSEAEPLPPPAPAQVSMPPEEEESEEE